VLAFIALPGVIGYLVPLLIAPDTFAARATWRWGGLIMVAAGTSLLLWCVREFYVSGKGTLAPWSPPQHLVTAGLYRWSRNPMYVALAVVLLGWSTTYASFDLLIYACAAVVAFHLRVILYEEPRLAAFGDDWVNYRARVRRWF
jgi:protein-S-isoprenylcysteine O-methyltransferase Ste14